ncbi:MAG: S8 family serine peptidase [Bacteroidales bacterium]|nr:S8 family serine peptidase [Bacteroidales bacterium]
MKYLLTLIFVSCLLITLYGQYRVAPDTYVINFIDKDTSFYSVNKPSDFLSERAIKRRQKYNIPVTLQDMPVNKNYINKVKELGFEIYAVSKWMNCVIVYTENANLLKKLNSLDFVTNSERKNEKKKKNKQKKNKYIDIESISDKESVLDYGSGTNQIEMLNLHNLHNKGYMGQGIQIAVLDAGFYSVDSLAGFDSVRVAGQILGTKDFVERDGDVYDDATHGLSVLSTIAANLPGKLIGSAPKANYWLLRSEDERSEYLVEEYYWLSAAEYADSLGVDIIHSSLGYNDFDDESTSHTYEDMNGDIAISSIAADIASAKGILVVTSAGNEGSNSWKYITSPADADSVLTVGATKSNGKVSNFSSRGPSSDNRIKPDVMAQGTFAWVIGRYGGVYPSNGTSFSGPIIAGAVACLWQANPEFSNMEIIDALHKSSDRFTNPDADYGYGIPDFNKADLYLKKLSKARSRK